MKRLAPSLITAVILFLTLGFLTAQQNTLTNDSIVQMVKGGLGEDVVLSMIQNQPGKYALTPENLLTLKAQGVTDRMLATMVNKGTISGTPSGASVVLAAAVPIATGDPNDPLSPHDPGIWLYIT